MRQRTITHIPLERPAVEAANQRTAPFLNECSQVAAGAPEHSLPGDDKNSTREINEPKIIHNDIQVSFPSDTQHDYQQRSEVERSKTITGRVAPDDSLCICIGPLKLYVEYAASHIGSIEHIRKDLEFDHEGITNTDDGLGRRDAGYSVIEIEKSPYSASLPLNSSP
jgi:hypothetical protein